MGKDNRRRTRAPRTRAPRGAVPIVSDLSDLHEHLRFKCEEDAFAYFEARGFRDIRIEAPFSSTSFSQHLELNLARDGYKVSDATHLLATGHDPFLPSYSKLGVQLLQESQKHPHRAFLVVRTRSNAIAFAGGFCWGIANVRGVSLDEVFDQVREEARTDLPFALIFCNGRTSILPTMVLQHSVATASQVGKALVLQQNSSDFKCSICFRPIVKNLPGTSTMQIQPFLVPTKCFHVCHRACIFNHLLTDPYPGCAIPITYHHHLSQS
jgi:hypothetical protein